MPGVIQLAGSYKQVSATGNVSPRPAVLQGVFCSTSSSGTLTVYDDAGTGTSTKAVDTFNLVAGTYYEFQLGTTNGIYLVIGGSASLTAVYA